MSTIFDVLTVGAFIAMAGAYFVLANGDQKIMLRLLIPGVMLAVANQVGNHGYTFFAVLLLVAGGAYAVHLFRNRDGASGQA